MLNERMNFMNCGTEIISTDPKESATNIRENVEITLCDTEIGRTHSISELLYTGRGAVEEAA